MAIQQTEAPLLGEPLPVELMNTIWADRDGVHEALGTPTDTAAWLRAVSGRPDIEAHGLSTWLHHAGQRDLATIHHDLRSLRDAARRLAARRTEDSRASARVALESAAALATVNDLATAAPSWPVLDWPDAGPPRTRFGSESTPGAVFVADLARSTVTLLGGDVGETLRACQAPGCVLYFVKQHPRREWCSAACGNRARQARHYRRRQAAR